MYHQLKMGDEVIVHRQLVKTTTCSGYRAWENETLPEPIRGIFVGTRRLQEGYLNDNTDTGVPVMETEVYTTVALVYYHPTKNPIYVRPHYICLAEDHDGS